MIGGYGTFGGRLVQLLADEPRLRLIVAGRSLSAAQAFCRMASKASLDAVAFDRAGDIPAALSRLRPDIVVDASGPFQSYGSDPYRVARAALEAGADYLDIADAAEFVLGIEKLDALARAKGRFALSGVSSFPVLTAAVVRRLAAGLDEIDAITAGIAPSPYATVGLNVVRAIASYAGKTVDVVEAGQRVGRHGFVDSRRLTVNVPGRLPLRPIRFGLVEVPDIAVLARDWPQACSIWAGAGPTPAILHRLLWACGWLVRLRLLPSLRPFAPIMNRVINTVRWGEHRGGMIVEVTGRAEGQEQCRSWHLLAEGDDGPMIPSMAAEAIIRHCLEGRKPQPGARPAHRDLELEDYGPLLAKRKIFTGFRTTSMEAKRQPLYERALGEAASRLSEPVRSLHRFAAEKRSTGRATVSRGTNPLARLVGLIVGFPPATADGPVEVVMTRSDAGVETWRRNFAGHSFSSTQELGDGRWGGLIVERFGRVAVGLAALEIDGRLHVVPRRWTVLGIPMPMALGPRATAFEHGADGRFNFDVALSLPLIGHVGRYRGWLATEG